MEIRLLNRSEAGNAVAVLSRGMRDNPVNVAAFGGSPDARQSKLTGFFQSVLEGQFERGEFLGAFYEESLVGVCGITRPGCCQPSGKEKALILGRLLFGASLGSVLRVGQWAGEWAKHDPRESHWHLGPVAVEPSRQGQGIGSALLKSVCNRMDQQAAMLYLETDKEENVRFYQKHGFEVVGHSLAIDQKSWYMRRLP
jgi:ribosomal protein S18 acetylase RimI-like enzyme